MDTTCLHSMAVAEVQYSWLSKNGHCLPTNYQNVGVESLNSTSSQYMYAILSYRNMHVLLWAEVVLSEVYM